MSFFSNCSSDNVPSRITGNPINGLCEKVCIQAKKVFDACMKQSQEEGFVLTLTNLTPANPTYPLTFVSARSTDTTAQITSLQVDPIQDRQNLSRVQITYVVPMEVIYTDANGVQGKATSSVTLSQDVILCIPSPSIMPYSIETTVSIVAPEGVYTGENTFTVSCCATSILKVVMSVEILVPTYGYANIPACQEYTQEVCSGFFELPLFPTEINNL
ncbi:MAG: hypothetical protein J6Q38_05485 [Clostridia bacterium]|nr:hypothetical protein [Clostridia bacterium]